MGVRLPSSTRRAAGPRSADPYHHGDLQRALIKAAERRLELDGPEAISFRAIARDAGVSQTAPYNHFKGKEHLLATLAAQGLNELCEAQRRAAQEQAPGVDRIVALGMDYIRFALERPQRYRLMFGTGLKQWRDEPEVIQAKGASFGPLREALAEYLGEQRTGAASGEADETAVAAWALVHGLAMLLIDQGLNLQLPGRADAMQFVQRVLSRYATGLRASRRARSRSRGGD